ncbi:MAG: EAL domain-containing protein [bacterium]|nr:EAL domain-containing protein [bacterium]
MAGQRHPYGQDLNLDPIAEGVSHRDQAEFLAAHGCLEMQGFYFSAAISPRTFREKPEID